MFTPEQQKRLAQSEAFQRILAEDSVLSGLKRERINKQEERFSMLEMFHSLITIEGETFQPITPAVWAFLWAIGNHYTDSDYSRITESDTDVFLWILHTGLRNIDCTPAEIAKKADKFCPVHGIDYVTAARELAELIRLSFRPLTMLAPAPAVADEERSFDADWLVALCSAVSGECGEPARELMFTMPLSTALYFYINAKRKLDPHSVISHRLTDQELMKRIVERIEVLGKEFLQEDETSCQQKAK